MPKTKQQKADVVVNYTDKVKQAKSMVFVNFQGLKVKEIEKFRKHCRQQKLDYVVAKKTLMARSLKDAGINVDTATLESAVGTLFSYTDEVAAAKAVGTFGKEFEALKPVGGILEGAFIDGAKVIALSKLPTKQELLAKMLGSLKAPITGLVNVMSGPSRGLVCALNAIAQSKQ